MLTKISVFGTGFLMIAAPVPAAEPAAPVPGAVTTAALAPARVSTESDVVGYLTKVETKLDETLLDVAYRHGLGFIELVAANPGIDPWLPGDGTEVLLPGQHILPDAPREGVVINLAEMRLYYYPPDDGPIETYPVGIGRAGQNTPTGETRISRKRKDPVWYPTEATRADNPDLPKVVGPGPENPLGSHALDLGWPLYLIHGTNNVWGIGRRVSRGCIRMYPNDIARLFDRIAPGTPVNVVDQPLKFAWVGNDLYMEAHTTQAQAEQLEETGEFEPDPDLNIAREVGKARGDRGVILDWDRIEAAVTARRGVPVKITL